MSVFRKVFEDMGNAISDLSTLEVTMFEGSVDINAESKLDNIAEVLEAAKGNADVKCKLVASTKSFIDGDIVAFYDHEIDEVQRNAHAELVDMATESRQATIDMIKDILDNPGGI